MRIFIGLNRSTNRINFVDLVFVRHFHSELDYAAWFCQRDFAGPFTH